MFEELNIKNASIKDLKLRLKQTSARQSVLEIDSILSNITDKKAFILLLDMYETEKEITRDLLESLIDHSYELNSDIIFHMEYNMGFTKELAKFFEFGNFKSVIMLALAIGIILSIIFNPSIIEKIIDTSIQPNKEVPGDKK